MHAPPSRVRMLMRKSEFLFALQEKSKIEQDDSDDEMENVVCLIDGNQVEHHAGSNIKTIDGDCQINKAEYDKENLAGYTAGKAAEQGYDACDEVENVVHGVDHEISKEQPTRCEIR